MTAPTDLPIDAGHQAVNSRLRSVQQWLGAKIDWHPMPQTGTSNRLYRGALGGRPLVLRLNADQQLAFGVDRQREGVLLEAIQGYDWAPCVLHNSPVQGWCLMADHGGEGERQDPTAAVPLLLDAIEQWQQINLDAIQQGGLDYAALLSRYRQALNHRKEPEWEALLARFDRVHRALPTVRHCLTHHDLHLGNLCFDDSSDPHRWVVLDWEYAAVANPWFDAAALQRQFGVLSAELAALPAWNRLNLDQFETGLRSACWLNEALECLWYAVRPPASNAHRQQAQRLLSVPLRD